MTASGGLPFAILFCARRLRRDDSARQRLGNSLLRFDQPPTMTQEQTRNQKLEIGKEKRGKGKDKLEIRNWKLEVRERRRAVLSCECARASSFDRGESEGFRIPLPCHPP